MPELTKEEKIKIFEKLPKELQDLMSSEDTGAFLLFLGGKYNLPDEKTHQLSKIIGDVVLGILPLPNLASEITNKIAVDQNIASQISQEINSELFAPVANLLKGAPTPISTPQVPSTDRYREPTAGGPEIIDLRKTPPPPMPAPVAAAPIPPSPRRSPDEGGPKPLTFTKPVESPTAIKVEPPRPVPPLTPMIEIEADPHKMEVAVPTIPTPVVDKYREDINVLDLRQDKGEF